MEVRTFPLGPLQTNCFVIASDSEAVAIDPGGDPGSVLRFLEERGLTLTHILNTHFHFDHIHGNAALTEATSAPILASDGDASLMQVEVFGGGFMGFPAVPKFEYQTIEPGPASFLGEECQVLATPGHSPGSVSFYFPGLKRVFAGDLIFARSIGRTDFPGGDMETLLTSVREKIFTLPEETVIHSGHGADTSVGEEKEHNPFFSSYSL
ncbi:MAG: MBL fold metallo-hydrolase [Desulfovibrio sp.]|nr:MAG: MBL fold metallo-hydrolase [Desulfovibrio sp.]